MKKVRIVLLMILVFPLAQAQLLEQVRTIVQIDLDVVVHPVSADYVRSGITYAKEIGARAVIIRINTPGGLLDSMRDMVGAILDSDVPVITWVGPNGSRAASAGFFILLAGDVAAMAPGTNTGAAHPVSGSGGKIEDVMEKKVVSDITAYIRSYVSKRGRNTAMAELGIVESRSFSQRPWIETD
jgi:membrane-bound serine protease (ClpP class)